MAVRSALLLGVHTAAARQVSFWYSPASYDGGDIDNTIKALETHSDAVTNLFIYCGHQVVENGLEVDAKEMSLCVEHDIIARVAAVGVKPEFVVNSGRNNVADYRKFWANSTSNIAAILADAKRLNVTGISFDLEPQVGSPSSTKEDAQLYANFLAEAKTAFSAEGLRLTVAVAEWSPMLQEYKTLSASVDRLLDMETYSADSLEGWLKGDNYGGYYESFLAGSGKTAGPGLGAWNATCGDHVCWSSKEESGAPRLQRMAADGVEEVAMFRIVQQDGAEKMPQEWWWPLLADYLAGGKEVMA